MKRIIKPYTMMMTIAVVVLLIVLLLPLGVGEGGGQYQLLERVGLGYQTTPQSGVVQMTFDSGNSAFMPKNAHEAMIGMMNVKPGIFDLRILGLFYSLLLLIGMGMLMKGISQEYLWHKWLTAAMVVFVLCDFAYTTYFNSLFWNPFAMVLILLCGSFLIMIYKRGEAGIWSLIGLLISSVIFATISTITALIGLIIGILMLRLFSLGKNALQKTFSLICGLAVITVGIFFAATYTAPTYENDLYSAVFFGTTQYESVTELGLDPKLDELKGVFYSAEIAQEYQLKESLYQKMNYSTIMQFYLSHPKALFGALTTAASNGLNIRLAYAGNFTEASAAGELANGFNLYSIIKNKFMPNTLLFLFLVFVAYFGVLGALYFSKNTTKQRKMYLELLFALGICAIISFIMPYMQTGSLEIGRGLFVFYLLFDFMILSAVIGGSMIMMERRQRLKDKYGVKQ